MLKEKQPASLHRNAHELDLLFKQQAGGGRLLAKNNFYAP